MVRKVPFFWDGYNMYWRFRCWLESRREYQLPHSLLSVEEDEEPTIEHPVCQLCTSSQIRNPTYRKWCKEIDSPPRFSRKQWEFAYIMQVLWQAGMLRSGKKGVGFGCGTEPLPGIFAKYGCRVLATDLEKKEAEELGWVGSLQHAGSLESLYESSNKVLERDLFFELVSFKIVDMNDIPVDLGKYDFTWSACAFEHLGSLRKGMEFVKNTCKLLKPGGVAVHTTEFNLSSNDNTMETPGCSVYRRKDIQQLVNELQADGLEVAPFNFHPGKGSVDHHVDIPPYGFSPHLKTILEEYVVTSIGLIIRHPVCQ